MATLEHLEARACIKRFHANKAGLLFCAPLEPHFCCNAIDLRLRVASVHVPCILLHLHQLLVRHSVNVRVVRVMSSLVALRLLNCPLQEPLFLSLRLISTSPRIERHHNKLSFLHPIFHLIHLNRHLHLRQKVRLVVDSSSIAISHCQYPCRIQIIIRVVVSRFGSWSLVLLVL